MKGKQSTSQKLEIILKMKMKDILPKHFKGIKTIPEAQQKLTDISNGQLIVSPPTILKMVEDAKGTPEDYPFIIPVKKETEPHRKQSTSERLTSLLKEDIKNILVKHFKGIPTLPEAQQKLRDISNNEIDVSPITLLKMLFEAKVDLSLFPFAKPEEKKHKGRQAQEFDYSQFEQFKNCDKDGAADAMKIKVSKLYALFQKGVEQNKIKAEDYTRWFKVRKPHEDKDTPVDKNLNGQKIAVQAKCECGQKKAWYTRLYTCGAELNLGLKGRKCPDCGKYGSFMAIVKDNDVLIRKAVVAHDDVLVEEFVDIDRNIIQNPLPEDFVSRYNQPEVVVVEQ